MKVNLLPIIFSLIIIKVQLNLRAEKRKELLDKLTTKISFSDIDQNLFEYEDDEYISMEDSFKQMNYNLTYIKELLQIYGFPESYNYLNETGATKIVKNQQSCGCCWSFAATSALAYRYKKYGIDINLSPQDAVSCFKKDCRGTNLLDPQLNLVKNGTVTEECFPYKSSDGETIPECPSQCEDGSEFKKYHSQNAYLAENYEQENFHDLVLLVIDQLVNQGPIAAGFYVHEDLYDFAEDEYDCKNDVYTYNGVARLRGGHAITIVGYGIHYKKFYWIVQNSWGDTWCDNGFIKMEIGQFDELSFSEPQIDHGQTKPVQIDVKLEDQYSDCSLVISSSSLSKWNNTLNVNFQHEKTNDDFDFQIGRNKLIGEDEINCFYENNKAYYQLKKGKYIYKGFESLGKDNTFKLNSFQGKSFDFYGWDEINSLTNEEYYYYVSQEGSRILFEQYFEANDSTLPKIYLDKIYKYPFTKCDHVKISTKLKYNFVFCEFSKDNINYIEKNQKQTVNLYYDILCGYPYNSNVIIKKLDTKNYPVFKVIQFIKPNFTELNKDTDLILVSKITGGTKFFKNEGKNQFYVIMEVESFNDQNITKNSSVLVSCSAQVNYTDNETNLTCHINAQNYTYENIYLLPYSLLDLNSQIFEVFIRKEIKAGDDPINPDPEPEPEPPKPAGYSYYLKYPLTLSFCLLLSLL